MAQQIINIGTAPSDGSGDPIRVGFDKVNQNFTELFVGIGATGMYVDWGFVTDTISSSLDFGSV